MSKACFIGLDVGGTKTAVSLGTAEGEILAKHSYPSDGSWEKVLGTAVGIIGDLRREYSACGLRAIGISCGGPLDSRTGIVVSPPNLPLWRDVPVCGILTGETGLPAYLENDANACALAEWIWGAGRGTSNMVFLTFGTGLGAGMILNGRLYCGACGLAGEIGHLRMAETGPLGYGKRRSWEAFCSGGGMSAHYTLLHGVNLTAKEICRRAHEGDPLSIELIRTTADYLGRGISILIDTLNPEKIIIGSIFAREEELFRPAMERAIETEALTPAAAACTVEPAQLGEALGDMAALGVARNGIGGIA